MSKDNVSTQSEEVTQSEVIKLMKKMVQPVESHKINTDDTHDDPSGDRLDAYLLDTSHNPNIIGTYDCDVTAILPTRQFQNGKIEIHNRGLFNVTVVTSSNDMIQLTYNSSSTGYTIKPNKGYTFNSNGLGRWTVTDENTFLSIPPMFRLSSGTRQVGPIRSGALASLPHTKTVDSVVHVSNIGSVDLRVYSQPGDTIDTGSNYYHIVKPNYSVKYAIDSINQRRWNIIEYKDLSISIPVLQVQPQGGYIVDTTNKPDMERSLPMAILGSRIMVQVKGNYPLKVFPAAGEKISGYDESIEIDANKMVEFCAGSHGTWYIVDPAITTIGSYSFNYNNLLSYPLNNYISSTTAGVSPYTYSYTMLIPTYSTAHINSVTTTQTDTIKDTVASVTIPIVTEQTQYEQKVEVIRQKYEPLIEEIETTMETIYQKLGEITKLVENSANTDEVELNKKIKFASDWESKWIGSTTQSVLAEKGDMYEKMMIAELDTLKKEYETSIESHRQKILSKMLDQIRNPSKDLLLGEAIASIKHGYKVSTDIENTIIAISKELHPFHTLEEFEDDLIQSNR